MKKFLILFFFTFLCKYSFTQSPEEIDNLKSALKKAKHDTSRLEILRQLSETAPDGEWEAFNDELINVSEQHLKTETDPGLKKAYLGFYAGGLNNKGLIYQAKVELDKALELAAQSLEIRREINDRPGIAQSLNILGITIQNQGDIMKALEYFHEALQIQEKLDEKMGIANSLNNIAAIYQSLENYDKALEYYTRSLKIVEALNVKYAIAKLMNNIANLFHDIGRIEEAYAYYKKTALLQEEIGDKGGVALVNVNIGQYFKDKNLPDSARFYFEKGRALAEAVGEKATLAAALHNIGTLYWNRDDYVNASKYISEAMRVAKELNYIDRISKAAVVLYDIYKHQGNTAKALEMFELHIKMRDSIASQENRKAALKKQFQYESGKKEAELKAGAKAEKEKLELKAAEDRKRQNIIIYSVIAGLVMVSIFSVFIYRSLRRNKEANKIISVQKQEVENQKHIIEEKQKEVLDSIHYAKRIQKALITNENYIHKKIKNLTKG
jgi:tetratricopeptide (TPR) repeat protein